MARGKTRRRKSDATRQALLDAALSVIARKGYSAATVDEIVKEAGVSKGLAYYHFKNKAAIASAILSNGLTEITARFEGIAREAKSGADALRGMFYSFVDLVVDNRNFCRFFMSELWREGRVWSNEMSDEVHGLVEVIAGQFERGKREGSVPAGTDSTFDAVSCIGLVLSTSMAYFGDESDEAGTLSKEDFAKHIGEFVSHGTSVEFPAGGRPDPHPVAA